MQAAIKYPIQPAHLDLASYIGECLARPNLTPERRALFHRVWAHMNCDAHKRLCAAYAEAVRT